MNTRVLTGIAAAGMLVVVSCSQDQPSVSSPGLPTQASFVVAPSACSFTSVRSAAQSYFALAGDPVYALINTMEHAYLSGGAAAATSPGFDVLARLGVAADAGATLASGPPAQGSAFANAVLACMSVTGYTSLIDFSSALGPNGLFAVRDGNVATAVISRLVVGGAPSFGAEPSTGNWPVSGKTLFYGHTIATATLANETPAGDVFDLTTLPSGLTFAPEIKAGVCQIDDPNARILHAHAGDPAVILPPAGALSFCPLASNATRSPMSGFASAANRLASWLAPQPAQAAAMARPVGGGGAGLVSGLSEIGPVSYTSVVFLTVPPRNSSVSKSPQFRPIVTVKNVTSNGTALKGAVITLTVTINKGSFTISGNTAVTDAAGIATFPSLTLDKPGGYTLTATSELGGSASSKFQINGQ